MAEQQDILTSSYHPALTGFPVMRLSVGAALRRAAQASPDRMALVEVVPEGMPSPVGAASVARRWTYARLLNDAEAGARWLLQRHRPGDRICVWAPNAPEWVILQYATALAGMVLVTANPALRAEELTYVLEQSDAGRLFHLDSFRGVDTAFLAHAVAARTPHGVQTTSFSGWLDEVRARADEAAIHLPEVGPDDPAQIQYTSGTTGRPKGALLHHCGLVTNASYVARRAGLDGGILLSPMPLFHTAGSVMSVLGCATTGSTLVLPLMFEPALIADALKREKANVLFGVPTMLLALVEHLNGAPETFEALHAAVSGGASVPPELHARVGKALGCPLLTVYGQTELSPIVCQTDVSDSDVDRINTVGRPLWNVEVRIADPASNEVRPLGIEGEIQARGYQTMLGYFGDANATRDAFTADGWLRTGDLGTMDERGYCRVTGRLKDMIIRGGENIYPAEVEACVMRHPDVLDVSVFGVQDSRWGEVVAAAVRLRAGCAFDPGALTAFCKSELAPHKAPTLWTECEQFPMTLSGKIQKFRLQEAVAAGDMHMRRAVPA